MNTIISKYLALTIFIVFIATERACPQQYDFTRIDSLLESAVPQIGGSSLVLVKDGKTIYKKGFGGFKPNTRVPVMSASKWLAAAAVMTLVDRKLIKLDEPVSKYLPKFKGKKEKITIRQLLSHTSGIFSGIIFYDYIPKSLKLLADYIAENVRVEADPGTEFYYGGVTFLIAGRLAEVVSGKDWETFFTESITEPCEMANTDFGNVHTPNISAGAQSTASDYAKFLQMFINSGKYGKRKVISAASVREMKTDHVKNLPSIFSMYDEVYPPMSSTRHGLGIWLEKIEPLTGEVIEISSQGFYGFSPWINYRKNLAGVFAVKNDLNNVMPVYLKLKDIINSIIPDKITISD